MGNLTVNVAGLTKLGCTVVGHHRIPQNCLTHLYLSSARLVFRLTMLGGASQTNPSPVGVTPNKVAYYI